MVPQRCTALFKVNNRLLRAGGDAELRADAANEFFSFLKRHFPQINAGFSGFGAEEWYVAEKVRQNGGRVICHPQLGWNHRFDWPPRTFPLRLVDKVRNYYLGWLELYGSLNHPMVVEMTNHWRTQMPIAELDAVIHKVFSELGSAHCLKEAHS